MEQNKLKQRQTLLEKEQICWLEATKDPEPGPSFCPRVFDGIACWPPTAAGSLVVRPCPDYFNGFFSQNAMSKQCTSSGQWLVNAAVGSAWTNYSSCAHQPGDSYHQLPFNDRLDLLNYTDNHLIRVWTPVIKHISRTGYCISLTALIVAMFIFCSIRKLRSCPRNGLHVHLFMSFVLKALTWIGMDLVPQHLLLPSEHGSWQCKAVTTLWQYFTLANYTWVTMEALYLFCLIQLAIVSDASRITIYVLIGWGFPVIFVSGWAAARALNEDVYCWRVSLNQAYFWIIRSPTVLLIMVNAVLFFFIIFILKQKLTATVSPETRRYRRLAQSTIVLMPLFGFHYTLLIGLSAFINRHRVAELVWLFWDQLFASFQGFSVALLYCFSNGEVKQELRKIADNFRHRHFGVAGDRRAYRLNSMSVGKHMGRFSVQSTTLMDTSSHNRSTSPYRCRSHGDQHSLRLQPHTEETQSNANGADGVAVPLMTSLPLEVHTATPSRQQDSSTPCVVYQRSSTDETVYIAS